MNSRDTLRLRDVEIALGARVLVSIPALEVDPGEAVTVMGPSGSGKSALLAFLCGALDPAFTARGEVRIGDDDITSLPTHRRRIGILFQDDLLFPHLTVAENLAFGLRADGLGPRARRDAVEVALIDAELAGYGDRDPATLSGGQRARVALMRALIARPRALLLDEPFGRLDRDLRERFRTFVFAHARERDLPVLLVTHDEADARAAGGPVVVLAGAGGGATLPPGEPGTRSTSTGQS